MDTHPARVGGYIRCSCKEHGDQETHYCSNSKFFKDAMSYATPPKGDTLARTTHHAPRTIDTHLGSLIV